MAFIKFGNSEMKYEQNVGKNSNNNNMNFGDASIQKLGPTAVQKAMDTAGNVIQQGGDLLTSWASWVKDFQKNFSFYLVLIFGILLLVLILYIIIRCYRHRSRGAFPTKQLIDIATIMAAKNSIDQPPPLSIPAARSNTLNQEMRF